MNEEASEKVELKLSVMRMVWKVGTLSILGVHTFYMKLLPFLEDIF